MCERVETRANITQRQSVGPARRAVGWLGMGSWLPSAMRWCDSPSGLGAAPRCLTGRCKPRIQSMRILPPLVPPTSVAGRRLPSQRPVWCTRVSTQLQCAALCHPISLLMKCANASGATRIPLHNMGAGPAAIRRSEVSHPPDCVTSICSLMRWQLGTATHPSTLVMRRSFLGG